MKKYDVVIIGAGPAGIVTGITAKKQFPDKSMLIIKEDEKSLVPCGIPYVFHELESVSKNVMGPKGFIDLGGEVVTDPVVKVDVKEKQVKTKSGEVITFDKLVFATGSRVVIPDFIPGYDLKNVFYIRKNYDYIEKMVDEIKDKKNIVVVGGGFIGAEVAEQLAKNPGKKVSIVESETYCFSKTVSQDLSKLATEQLKNANVNVYTSTLVEKVIGKDGLVTAVQLNNKSKIEADAVIFSVGYMPNAELAKNAGLQLNKMGAIHVDNYGRATEKDIFAVGDCSQTLGFLTGRSDNIMLASTAAAEARILGYNIYGVTIKNSFTGTLGIFSTEINGLSMASVGLNEKNAVPANIKFVTAQFTACDRHPEGIKDSSKLTVKLYVSPSDGSILGAEVWGGKCAGEIINTIGLAIQKELTVYELISLQIGTHPLLTSAPTMPVFIKAAEAALYKIQSLSKQ
ncbi:MAG: FAD-dependent oxidoreductase [Calditrichaceae bacterium]|nr:FAD-dependent oxidoreductase [Calditrichaceae bacterium]MBN2710027.1 FAD-dependent oxidoreductase [Calditrichaceae bacterium]RQV92126.1 MAG: pyridine nucleotide-disulfide oxidoreductase [Calditrichota bacterium]